MIDSGYTIGEAQALIAPILGLDPARVTGWAVVATTDNDVRVAGDHGNPCTITMLAAAIADLAGDDDD